MSRTLCWQNMVEWMICYEIAVREELAPTRIDDYDSHMSSHLSAGCDYFPSVVETTVKSSKPNFSSVRAKPNLMPRRNLILVVESQPRARVSQALFTLLTDAGNSFWRPSSVKGRKPIVTLGTRLVECHKQKAGYRQALGQVKYRLYR